MLLPKKDELQKYCANNNKQAFDLVRNVYKRSSSTGTFTKMSFKLEAGALIKKKFPCNRIEERIAWCGSKSKELTRMSGD